MAAIYDVLMRYNTSSNTYSPELAQSLTPNASDTVWTLKLRPNVTFSDGEAYNAQAVVENLQRDQTSLKNTSRADLALVQSLSAPDSLTVKITLSKAWSGFPYALANKSGNIAAPNYISALQTNPQATPIGAGPYMVQTFRPAEELTLIPNPHYWGPAPYLSSLHFAYIAGGTAALQALQTGQVQAASFLDAISEHTILASKLPNFSNVLDFAGQLVLNTRPGAPFNDMRLRKAVAEAISPQIFNERIYQGLGQATNLPFPPGSEWYYQGEKGIAYNPTDAKKLVAEVKQQTGWNGIIRVVGNNTTNQVNDATTIESMLTPIGITVQANFSQSIAGETQLINIQHNFDMGVTGYGVVDAEPYVGLFTALDSASPTNLTGLHNPQMDQAIDGLRTASNKTQQAAAIKDFVSAWDATIPGVEFVTVTEMLAYSSSLHGLVPSVNGVMLLGKAWMA